MMKNIFNAFLFSMVSVITYGQGGNPIMIITCRNAPAAKANSVGFQSKATPDCSTFKGMCPGGFADWEFCVPDPITGELNFTWDPIREICDCELNEGIPIYNATLNPTPLPDADDCGCPINTSPILMSWPSGDNFTCGFPVCYSDTYTPIADCNGATINVELCGIPIGGFIELDNLLNCDIVENFEVLEGQAVSSGNNVAFGPAKSNGCFSFTLLVDDPNQAIGIDFISADDLLIAPNCEITLGALPIIIAAPVVPTLKAWSLIILAILLITMVVVTLKTQALKEELGV